MKDIVIKSALEGGKILMKYYQSGVKEISKGERDIVTVADTESEKRIIEILQSSFPEHNFRSEEIDDLEKNSDYTWIIDPLDGTTNFASKIPLFAVSIALMHKREIILACIYVPVLGETYFAEKDKGATLNDTPIKVSSRDNLRKCINIVSPGIKTEKKIAAMSSIITSIMPLSRSIVIYGSTPLALAFVACGRADSYITYNSDVYNMAAGYLLIKEAGGQVTDFSNKEFDIQADKLNVIASNGSIHEQILPIIQKLNL